jgi:hypothetical protein
LDLPQLRPAERTPSTRLVIPPIGAGVRASLGINALARRRHEKEAPDHQGDDDENRDGEERFVFGMQGPGSFSSPVPSPLGTAITSSFKAFTSP